MTTAVVRTLGEPIECAAGRVVLGVVDLPSVPQELRPPGTRLALSHQETPVVWLATDAAAGLTRGDAIQVRGTEYLIADLIPDGAGLTHVDLYRPGAESGTRPEWRAWR